MNRRSARTAWRNRRTFSGLAVLALASGMLLTLPAQAQSSYRVNYRSSVTIDDSVLNALGPAPTLTDVLVPVRGPVGDLAPRPQSARRPTVSEATLLPPPDRAPHSSLTSIPRPPGTPRITPLATIPANAGSATPSARPAVREVTRERSNPNAAYRPPNAERVDANAAYRPSQTVAYTPSPSPDPAAGVRVTPMPSAPMAPPAPAPIAAAPAASAPIAAPTASNSQLAARAPTVAAMAAAADALPMPRAGEIAPAPAPVPASPPSAYRPSITAPAPAPAAAPVEPPAQTANATVPPAAPVRGGNRLLFTSGSADLTPAMQQELDQIVRQMGNNDSRRLRVVAYAEGNAETASQARRLSLQRALAVRNYLGERGIIGTRVLVEAQGNQTQGGPADRVDLQLVSGS